MWNIPLPKPLTKEEITARLSYLVRHQRLITERKKNPHLRLRSGHSFTRQSIDGAETLSGVSATILARPREKELFPHGLRTEGPFRVPVGSGGTQTEGRRVALDRERKSSDWKSRAKVGTLRPASAATDGSIFGAASLGSAGNSREFIWGRSSRFSHGRKSRLRTGSGRQNVGSPRATARTRTCESADGQGAREAPFVSCPTGVDDGNRVFPNSRTASLSAYPFGRQDSPSLFRQALGRDSRQKDKRLAKRRVEWPLVFFWTPPIFAAVTELHETYPN